MEQSYEALVERITQEVVRHLQENTDLSLGTKPVPCSQVQKTRCRHLPKSAMPLRI